LRRRRGANQGAQLHPGFRVQFNGRRYSWHAQA
jgi:hypothetical protein